MDLNPRAEAAQRAARQAGDMLRHHGRITISQKSDNDFVTDLDKKSEAMIREALLGQFPEDEFYGEESGGSQTAEGRWIVDPIDGTQSFMRGQHGYAISIAYELHGELVIGCVYMPDFDEMFFAVRGHGATLNETPIHVSDISDPHQAIVHMGYGHRVKAIRDVTVPILPALLEEISDLRRYGSAAYAISLVAAGRSDIFFEMGLHIYDIAAGIVILEEAGGKATGWKEGEDCRRTGNIIATNTLLHPYITSRLNGKK